MKELKYNPKFIKSPDFCNELVTVIDGAKRRVILSAMVIWCNDQTEPVFDSVKAAIKRGVSTEIYIDNYSRTWRQEDFLLFMRYRKATKNIFAELINMGAKIKYVGRVGVNPFAGRYHHKIYIIDDIFFIGGMNLDFKKNPDTDLMIKIHRNLTANRLLTWLRNVSSEKPSKFDTISIDNKTQLLLDSGYGESKIYQQAQSLAVKSKRTIITSRMCPSGNLAKIISASNSTFYFNQHYRMKFPSSLSIIIDQIRYRIHNSYHSKEYLHAKTILFNMSNTDRAAIIGSNNFNDRGIKWHTREVALYSTDHNIINPLHKFILSLNE